jgi:hypothetical protein
MSRRSPTLEGFRIVFTRPSFGLAEMAWRWSFGAAAAVLAAAGMMEYLDTLLVSRGDLLLLRSRQPFLVAQAFTHIFRNSAPRFVNASLVLVLALAAAWVVVAALGRASTVRTLAAYFRQPGSAESSPRPAFRWMRSLVGLNLLRLMVTLAAIVGLIGSTVLGGKASSEAAPAPGSAMLIFLTVALLVWLAWTILNWFLSLSAVFVVINGADTLGAISSAVSLYCNRFGAVMAPSIWFGLAHGVAFFLAFSVVAFPLGFATVFAGGVVLGGFLLVWLLYSAAAVFLYAGRLAAYVCIVESPEEPVVAEPAVPSPRSGGLAAAGLQTGTIDRDELILSDVPVS